MSTATSQAPATMVERYRSARARTMELVEPLTPEDMMVQSTPEASPAKWHLAHTTWFFESFLLRQFLPGYRTFHPDFEWLFNSYYQSFAAFPEKRLRASFSRPGIEEILRYRQHVDAGIERLFDTAPDSAVLSRIELGVNHEEQHQELLLTDILHALFTNPLRPAYRGPAGEPPAAGAAEPLSFVELPGGVAAIGHGGEGFQYDNEMPRHRVLLEPYAMAARLVTAGEYAAFIADGGYRRPELWLSAGWDAVNAHHWSAPLYWRERDGEWTVFTLRGELPLHELEAQPVSQVSLFEADAYARWAGRRLPTEFEWEAAAEALPVEGNLLDSGRLMPAPCAGRRPSSLGQCFGDCWEWTASAYLGYPGFRPLPGSLGEYNGKFMSGQMVLRGGSCVTPARHIRPTYRNFFTPETRWQFSGIRLAAL